MKHIKLFEQFINEGFDKPLHKKLLKFIESTKTYMDIYDEDDAEQIMLQTRENGDVGYEEAGSEDVAEAERVQKLIKKKFPDLRVEIEEVDEWVHLNLMPNKTKEKLAEEKAKRKEDKIRRKSAKLIAKELNVTEKEALVIIKDFSYSKEYYEKNKDSRYTDFEVYFTHGKTRPQFDNAQQVFDFITKKDFAKDFYNSANPRNKVKVGLSLLCLTIKLIGQSEVAF